MTLFELQPNEQFISNPTLKEATQKLNRLIIDLQKRSLPADLIQTIKSKIEGINTSTLLGKPLEKLVSTTLSELLKLLEKELIEIKGKSEGVGKPLIYGTSEKFMEYFGINTIQDLPQPKYFSQPENQIGEERD